MCVCVCARARARKCKRDGRGVKERREREGRERGGGGGGRERDKERERVGGRSGETVPFHSRPLPAPHLPPPPTPHPSPPHRSLAPEQYRSTTIRKSGLAQDARTSSLFCPSRRLELRKATTQVGNHGATMSEAACGFPRRHLGLTSTGIRKLQLREYSVTVTYCPTNVSGKNGIHV